MSGSITMPALDIWITTILLTIIVIALRNAFLVAPREWLPRGTLERALRYAPLAALVALLAPDMLQPILHAPGFSPAGFMDPKVLSALAVIAVSRLTHNALAALVIGVAVFWWLG